VGFCKQKSYKEPSVLWEEVISLDQNFENHSYRSEPGYSMF